MTLKPRKRPDAEDITAVALRESTKPSSTENAPPLTSHRAADALTTARLVNPRLPPAELEPEDKTVNHNMRVRKSTLRALGKAADAEGMSVKQFIMKAIADKGVTVAPPDLENGKITPWRDR